MPRKNIHYFKVYYFFPILKQKQKQNSTKSHASGKFQGLKSWLFCNSASMKVRLALSRLIFHKFVKSIFFREPFSNSTLAGYFIHFLFLWYWCIFNFYVGLFYIVLFMWVAENYLGSMHICFISKLFMQTWGSPTPQKPVLGRGCCSQKWTFGKWAIYIRIARKLIFWYMKHFLAYVTLVKGVWIFKMFLLETRSEIGNVFAYPIFYKNTYWEADLYIYQLSLWSHRIMDTVIQRFLN